MQIFGQKPSEISYREAAPDDWQAHKRGEAGCYPALWTL